MNGDGLAESASDFPSIGGKSNQRSGLTVLVVIILFHNRSSVNNRFMTKLVGLIKMLTKGCGWKLWR